MLFLMQYNHKKTKQLIHITITNDKYYLMQPRNILFCTSNAIILRKCCIKCVLQGNINLTWAISNKQCKLKLPQIITLDRIGGLVLLIFAFWAYTDLTMDCIISVRILFMIDRE